MEKKYQIFISSTYEDLKSLRNQVIRAILEMGHIPVGMEMFSAGDEEQWEIIKRQIEQSDYYVVIAAHRYGSMIGELSYTEREYDYAASIGVPILGFIISEDAIWPENQKENSKELIKRLQNFKNKIGFKMVSFWKNEDDLYGKCCISLMKGFQAYPRIGWMKSDQVDTTEMMKEITGLSKENREFRAIIESKTNQIEHERGQELENVITALRSNQRQISIFEKGLNSWTRLGEISLLRIFDSIAPELVNEANEEKMMYVIAFEVSGKETLRTQVPVPMNYFRDWIADLVSLELIEPSEKLHSLKDKSRYWKLTNFGLNIHKKARKFQLLKGIAKSIDSVEDEKEI